MKKPHLISQMIMFISSVILFSLLGSCGGGSSSQTESEVLAIETNGIAQKGPYTVGSQVEIEMIDSVGIATGESIKTLIKGKNGRFSYEIPNDWREVNAYIQLTVKGSVFDEFKGVQTLQDISLSSIKNSTSNKQGSINILTFWVSQRAKVLLGKGSSLDDSLKQAKQELNQIFGISNVAELDFSNTASHLLSDNASLLLLSGALMEAANQNNVSAQAIINEVSGDFAKDGVINGLGNNWFKRLQAIVRSDPAFNTALYSRNLESVLGFDVALGEQLPNVINLASRPSSITPIEIIAEPNETIVLDGSASHDNSDKALINFTWFRVDQQAFVVPLSNRFSDNPTITVPSVASELLFALVVTDTDKLTDTSVVKVIVRVPDTSNNPPVAKDQSFLIDEDTMLNFTLDANDEDGDSLSYSLSTPLLLPNSIVEGGLPVLQFRPDLNFSGNNSFTYTANDGKENSNEATVSIEVRPINDRPIAHSQALTTNEDQAISLIILMGSDVDVGDNLTFSVINPPLHGSLAGISPNHSYTPDTDFGGSDSFSFVANDGILDSAQAMVNITVQPQNDAPIAVGDSYNINEDNSTVLNLLANDTDPDGDTLVVSEIDSVGLTAGTAQIIPVSNGDVSITALNVMTFIPDTNFFGSVSFPYEVSDENGGTATANVLITIAAINDAPIAVDDNYTVSKGATIPLTPLIGDTDPDGDTLVVSKINGVSLTGGTTQTIAVTDGDVSVSPSGVISFTEDDNTTGTVNISYEVSDGNGGFDTAKEIITVTSINNPPTAVNDNFIGIEDTVVIGDVILNSDTDPDGDTLAVTLAKIDINGDGALDTIALATTIALVDSTGLAVGTIQITANGDFVFNPATNVNGDIPQLTYTISDGNGGTDSATLDISLTPVNDAPVARSFAFTFAQGGNVTFSEGSGSTELGGTDPENDALQVVDMTDPVSNSVSSIIPITIGTYRFEPDPNFCGVDSIQYKVQETLTSPPLKSVSFATVTFNVTCAVSPKKAYLKATLPGPINGLDGGDSFGAAMAMSADGTTLAVGAPGGTKNRVYIYTFNAANVWAYQTTIQISNDPVQPRNQFGSSLSISNDGNKLVIGAPSEDSGTLGVNNSGTIPRLVAAPPPDVFNSGAVYLYERSGINWSLQAYFKANVTDENDNFGSSVSISGSGTTIAVGAESEDSGFGTDEGDNSASRAGAAYIFRLDGSSWSQEAYVKAFNISSFDSFGGSVSLSGSGDSLIVGATGEDTAVSGSGAVYSFTRAESWSNPQMIKQGIPSSSSNFGGSLAMSDDGGTFVASSKGENSSIGAAYIFTLEAGDWLQQKRLEATVSDDDDIFGSAVSISANGDKVIVGAAGEDGPGTGSTGNPSESGVDESGAVYLFSRLAGNWNSGTYIKSTNTGGFDSFGSSVVISSNGETIAVGAETEQSCGGGVGVGSGANPDNNGCDFAGAAYVNPHELGGD